MTSTDQQIYRYLAVLDFEATCDDGAKLRPQEIIEFPIVLLDLTQDGCPIVAEFHHYVKPICNPVLTAFCTSLTGIEQHTVDNGLTYPIVHRRLLEFINTHNLTTDNTLVATCGDWDLKTMLPAQLKVSHIPNCPELFQRWCNIKKVFAAVYNRPLSRLLGMDGMLNLVKLPLIGRHHSGIDDARNIASIARRLKELGYVFQSTSATPTGEGVVVPAHVVSNATASQEPATASTSEVTVPEHVVANAKSFKPTSKTEKKRPEGPDCGILIDIGANMTHASFNDKGQLADFLIRAKSRGVHQLVVTGASLKTSKEAIDIVRRMNSQRDVVPGLPYLTCTVGVHPHEATHALQTPNIMQELKTLIEANRDIVVAAGECGLDYDRNFSTPEDQRVMFEQQCQLSLQVNLPLFLHERSADQDFLAIVRKVNEGVGAKMSPPRQLRGVVHCYTGETVEHLQSYLDLGFYIGVTGWLTDHRPGRGKGLHDLCHNIPLDRLMVETDAPYLTPRGLKPSPRVNEPCLLPHVVKAIADCYNLPTTEIGARSTANAIRLFNLPPNV